MLLVLRSIDTQATKPPLCQAVYGLRMSPTGSLEKVLDAVRCHNADTAFIKSFLEQIKPQVVGDGLLELEISDCVLPSLSGPDSLARIGLRRLSIQQSGLKSLTIDSLAGQENNLEELDLSGNFLEEIPAAIRNLTALVRMDLSRNRIRSLPQGAVFFHLLKLRHLNLNYNRLGYLDNVRYPSGVAIGQTLPLAIFNLEPLRDHIETIQLRSNNLTAFPDQFSRPFGRLRQLDLSHNNFQSIPLESFSKMPQLGWLKLDNNELEQMPVLQLPLSLKTISIRGNPVRCDCSAVWLWQWSETRKNLTDGGELEMDHCVHPERWKGLHLADLPHDFCKGNETSSATSEEDDTENIMRSVSISAIPFSDRINVTIEVTANISTALNWTINYRQFGSGKLEEVPVGGMISRNQTQTLVNLASSTGYQVCVHLAGRAENQQRCLEVITLAEKITSYPVTEMAVAASVSTSTTLVIVILVCCCCPSIKCGKKGKKDKNGTLDGSSKDEVDQKNKVLTFASSAGTNSEPTAIWTNGEQVQQGQFSTFRGPGRPQHRPSIDDQSHQVFQATCNYLRERALDPLRGLGNRKNEGQLLEIVQPRRHSMTAQLPIYLTPIADGQLNPLAEQRRFPNGNSVHYFNSSYGLTEFHPGQSHPGPLGDQYKYCTWRPSKKLRHPPLLSNWTSYPDFLANSGSFKHPLSPSQPTVGVPVFSMTTSCRARRNRERFYWSAAPAPIHTVEMQF